MIVNGSPRASKSNSKVYAGIFAECCARTVDYYELTKSNHRELCLNMGEYSDVVFVFPLYADALPVGFLKFLTYLEANPPVRKPVVSILINCGFLEYHQNDVAVRMMTLFCNRNGYQIGSVLRLGSGEAILKTPFRYVAVRAVRRMAESVAAQRYRNIQATMPLTKKMFQMAATVYWTRYGKRFGTTKQQMQCMKIE